VKRSTLLVIVAAAAGASVLIAGCNTSPTFPPAAPTTGKRPQPVERDFRPSDIAKADIDVAAEAHVKECIASARLLMEKLYRRNPREWRKWATSPEDAITKTWDAVMQDKPLPELRGATSIDAVRLAFEATGPQAFQGDRVAALAVGWAGMLKQANGDTWSQNMIDGISAENAYRAARNFEISLWLLSSKLGPDGQPLLLSTEISERGRNLVADRELSKVVARLDLLAAQADEKYRRAAIDFSQRWLLGGLGPFLAMVTR